MEVFVSAVLGDLVSRSVSFVIDNYYRRQKGLEEDLQRLRRVLLRIQATVEEAEGRHITNQAMLHQLDTLREEMYKGCYLLDTFRYRMLFLEKCMFGRQAEMEKIISFLLQPEHPGTEILQVLPIVGPPRVGKRTLVEHVCYDERVRNHFSSIMICSKDPVAPEASDVLKKQIHGSHGRSLFVMELADDFVLDKRQRIKFLTHHMPPGSKVLVTSRSESIVELGTTGPIRLKYLPQEPYWYFFKVMAFGSTNPDEHPELASIAMEIAADLAGSFLSANILSRMLRANLHTQFWHKILELHRDHVQRNLLLFGEHPHTRYIKNQPVYIWSMSDVFMCIIVHSPVPQLHNEL